MRDLSKHVNSLAAQVLSHLHEGIFFVDKKFRITFFNKVAECITGYEATKLRGLLAGEELSLHVDVNGRLHGQNGCPIRETLDDGLYREADLYIKQKDGNIVPISARIVPLFDEQGFLDGAAQIFVRRDSKEKLIHEIVELRDVAMFDNLTGQRNRRFGERHLSSLITGSEFGLLFVDIDKFKNINDTYGHIAGDYVLKTIGDLIASSIRDTDTLIRWGGEEFLITAPKVRDLEPLSIMANKLRVLIANSNIVYGDTLIKVTLSIGATISHPSDTVASLVNRGDQLMYTSKNLGGNRVTVS